MPWQSCTMSVLPWEREHTGDRDRQRSDAHLPCSDSCTEDSLAQGQDTAQGLS
jgi:hypothetical protein